MTVVCPPDAMLEYFVQLRRPSFQYQKENGEGVQ